MSFKLEDYVSGSSVKNYLLKDPLLDYLDMYYLKKHPTKKKEIQQELNKIQLLLDWGIVFENKIFNELKTLYKSNCVQIGYSRDDYNIHNANLTREHINKGTPIIIQGILIDEESKTCGMADLIIRSDFINKIFNKQQLTSREINTKQYRVIDIKWTTLNLCANGELLRNSGRMPAYKGQLAIYNKILGKYQNYEPDKAYIMGHSWKYTQKNKTYSGHSCFDRLGHIDYKDYDEKYINETQNAINWIKLVRTEGYKWCINNPSNDNLYPNMSNTYDTPWHKIKSELANKNKDLTRLWMVGSTKRYNGFKNNVHKYTDKNCTSGKLGIKTGKISKIINKVIKINKEYNKHKIILSNKKDIKIFVNVPSNCFRFYVDFETLNTCFMYEPDLYNNEHKSNVIFMIGCGYTDENNKWIYKSFIMNEINDEEEIRVICEWVKYMEDIANHKYLYIYHWSHAEVSSIKIASDRHKLNHVCDNIVWQDLYDLFVDNPITIKGATSFRLKDIAKNMYVNGLIKTTWKDNSISDGLTAMLESANYYKTDINKRNLKIMQDIESYNKIDCKVLYEILSCITKMVM